ncbi:PVC-type heme-binding CxxCH protein [Haloferula sp. A504]|uniref:PVC-type heme-binding CxxCH protein n=1 Tax=Haloferula sp. A504 TaxID=3373601 RepID=UPI0031C46AD3|nr:GDSL-type esterase/lipase family protein [Verrucomicrobiaceae bacterium E54]
MTRLFLTLLALAVPLEGATPPVSGERIGLIGNGLGERMLDHPWLETELHLRYPDKKLVVRNFCRPGNTAGFRPHPSRPSQWAFPGADKFHPDRKVHAGRGHHPTPDEWLTTLKIDTLLAFFGYNESFDGEAGLEHFKGEIDAFITHTRAQKYNGTSAPRLILVSPIAFEDLSAERDLPDGTAENERLALYTAAMKEVAAARKVEFIDLFTATARLYPGFGGDFTRNGFLPTDAGYRKLGPALADLAFGQDPRRSHADPDKLAEAVRDKNWFWFNDYRMLNGVHVDGRRYKPFGPDNYPAETRKLRAMTEVRDDYIHSALAGKAFDLAAADSQTPELPEVKTNYRPSNKNGQPDYADGAEAVKDLTVPEGYKVELFASEADFPNLANPVQLSFDDRGRLWVATMPSYPHYRPGDERPDDKLLIYEDTDGDGRADKETVFADRLHLPTGFELAPGGVYVAENPHLMLLRDEDGNDQADSREIVLTGFDTHDTHHAAGAFCADPSGAIMMAEGVFLHTGVETPYGPVRGVDGGFYRFSPQRTKLERTVQMGIPNPWGIAFDDWGQCFFLHTSGPAINWMLPVALKTPYGAKNPGTPNLAPKGNAVRPTSGLEFVSSSHFPDEVQGDMLVCNTIGFLGIKQHRIEDDGTGYKTTFRQDLLKSSDGNFRPVDLEFAPDGSLYVADWQNALIGHMQHNARDPMRDQAHGRIYRITYPSRPLVKAPPIESAPLAVLLENLKHPDYRVRYRTRREIRSHDPEKALPALSAWVQSLDPEDPAHGHHQLEALWATWGLNRIDTGLLRKLLGSPDFRVRSATVKALRYNFREFDDHTALLMAAAGDDHGRVRLEAVAAASWLDNNAAKKIVAAAAALPLDNWSKNPTHTAASRLAGREEVEVEEFPAPKPPARLTEAERARFLAGHEIYHREGHCVTCHQPDGEGLPSTGFPPIAGTFWVQGNEERLIKLTLHGLMGPLEVKGVKYPGQVPMTPFAGLLDDEEIASVLTYVRNHFGNEASAITPEKVAEVRKATGSRLFYSPEELLKEHPAEN